MSALANGPSTPKVSVFQYQMIVDSIKKQVYVNLATRDTIWLKDNASSQLQTTLNQPISDVRLGTGTNKFVLSALPDGPSTPRVSVFQYQITATNGMLQEPVFLVSTVIMWLILDVLFLTTFVNL